MKRGLIFTLDALLLALTIILVCFPLIYTNIEQKNNIDLSKTNTSMMNSFYNKTTETYTGPSDNYCEKITDYNTQTKNIQTRIICEEKI